MACLFLVNTTFLMEGKTIYHTSIMQAIIADTGAEEKWKHEGIRVSAGSKQKKTEKKTTHCLAVLACTIHDYVVATLIYANTHTLAKKRNKTKNCNNCNNNNIRAPTVVALTNNVWAMFYTM